LPSSDDKVELFTIAKTFFENAGYEYIGLDHFAKPQDSLIQARKNGALHRNFQGYSTLAGLDTFAIGLTSISDTKTSYRQNVKDMQAYENHINNETLPIERGIILSADDIVRRGIIMDIMCSLKVVYKNYGVDFKTVFADAIKRLEEFQQDNLVQLFDDYFIVTDTGRIFLRNIAMLFDNRLSSSQQYSKTV
jgi:oxygen-independent coproporphyrinogen-3 oxidase